ncbi:MAG: peptidoglycan DD-metalloendopeptidase family protein [Candidatus Eisenbacteria bacterium]
MKRRHVTIMVVPDGSSKIRSLRISLFLAKSLFAIVPAALFVFALLLGGSLGGFLHRNPAPTLKRENLALRGRLERMTDNIEEVRRVLSRAFEFEKRARVLAQLDPVDEDVRLMGVGGPEPAFNDPLASFDPVLASRVRKTEFDVDELVRQTQLQTESLEKVVTELEDRRTLWNHIPSVCPVPGGYVSSGFGARQDPFTGLSSFHEGLDICAPPGTPVLATADGTVRFAGRRAGYGLTICIDHGRGLASWYAHVGNLRVSQGQPIKRGQVIGTVGTSGRATAPHVHYEVRVNSKAENPAEYILPTGVVVD